MARDKAMTQANGMPQATRRRLVVVYAVVVFLYWMGLYLYVPTLPVYTRAKTEDLALVGLVLSMYGLWQALVRLPLGIVSDWLGRRKPFILGGLVLVGLGALLMGTADGVYGVLVGRAVTGLSAGTWVPLVVVFNGLFPPAASVRATTSLMLVGSASRMLATWANGPLNAQGGYSLAFFLAAAVAAVAFVVVAFTPERRRTPKPPSVRSLTALVTRRDVMLPSLLNLLLLYLIWGSTFGFTPLLAERLGASDQMLSNLTSLNIGLVLLGNLFARAAAQKMAARPLVLLSFILICASYGIAALASAVWMVFATLVLAGFASGVGLPVLMGLSIRHVDDAERTTAMGLHQSVYAIGMFAGPWLNGVLADAIGIQPMFAAMGVVGLVVALVGTGALPQRDLR